MEVKDLLMNSENALPTTQDVMSTSTATSEPTLPTVTASQSSYWKFGGSVVLGLAGTLLLWLGKREKNLDKLIWGAILTLASFFLT